MLNIKFLILILGLHSFACVQYSTATKNENSNVSENNQPEQFNSLIQTIYEYIKYKQMLKDNLFINLSEKKSVLKKYKMLKNLLTDFADVNQIDFELINRLDFDPKKNSTTKYDSKARSPFKWG
jgi:hypothetical protein